MTQRKQIPAETRLRLFSEAAGHCQRPVCLTPLFPAEMGGDRHIGEMAHVIPFGASGPRHFERPKGEFDTETFENLILLCPTCHTIIDKDPEAYKRGTLLAWKAGHLAALATRQGIVTYGTRAEVRLALVDVLEENRAIWREFAPSEGAVFEFDPESETAAMWGQRVRSVILPNHFRIIAIIDVNKGHMLDREMGAFARYREHVRGLVERHICGVPNGALRYPGEVDGLFA